MSNSKFILIFILLHIFIQNSLAVVETSSIDNSMIDEEFLLGERVVRVPQREIWELLKDLPPWNAETKRWYMFADDWAQNADGNYILKGKFLAIDQTSEISKERLKLYEKPDKKSKWIFELHMGVLYQYDKPVCQIWNEPPLKTKVSMYSDCVYAFCEFVREEKEVGQWFYPGEMTTYGGGRFVLIE